MAKTYRDGQPPKPPVPGEIGDSAGMAMSGIIVNRDYNTKLTGTARIAKYDEMRLGDATVNATLLAIFLPILAARWRVDPASESRFDTRIADFVSENIFNNGTRTWQETLNEILLYQIYGCMPFEDVWEFRGDQVWLKKLSSRWPDTIYSWKLKGGADGICQRTVNGEFEMPMDKLTIFVNQKEGENWEGKSILRSAFKHWYSKDKLYLIDNIASERQGIGVPYAKFIGGVANPSEEAKMEILLQNFRANEKGYMMYKEGWEVGFIDMKGTSTKNVLPMVQHHDRQISKNVLAQFIELGAGNVGSFALSTDQSKLFIQSLESVANYIKDVMNKYLIKKLVDFNFIVEKYPELMFDKIGTVDANALTTSIQRLVQIGALTVTETDEAYLRDVMDLPEYDGMTAVDPTMADDILGELDTELAGLTGDGQDATDGAPVEDPNNPGMDMNGQPMPDMPTASWTDKQYRKAAEELKIKLGGPAGVPLSEETKRKISEALSKGKGKGKGKGKNPAASAKQKEIKAVKQEVKKLNDSVRRELLEMKAKGIKLSPEDTAKKQLEIFDKKTVLSDKIAKLQGELDTIKSQSAPAEKAPASKASEPDTMERINLMLDKYDTSTNK